ncbi:hypothetical protein [Symmachiella dynata]|uniref:hypothetical protein n=1 Tax=Symmachiella dynata TaxID=2527995 RepID=UPI0011A165D2|nr:hypothetical protein [Symmachiella dynata]
MEDRENYHNGKFLHASWSPFHSLSFSTVSRELAWRFSHVSGDCDYQLCQHLRNDDAEIRARRLARSL